MILESHCLPAAPLPTQVTSIALRCHYAAGRDPVPDLLLPLLLVHPSLQGEGGREGDVHHGYRAQVHEVDPSGAYPDPHLRRDHRRDGRARLVRREAGSARERIDRSRDRAAVGLDLRPSRPGQRLDTADDITKINELHVSTDTLYHYKLEANDVLHNFSVPVFRLKQDAIPGRVITGWFEPTMTGEFDIQCAEICGIGHGLMPARIISRARAARGLGQENSPLAAGGR